MADDASGDEGGRSWGGILLQGVAMMLVMQLLMGGMRGTTKTQSSTTDVDTVDTSDKSARAPSRVFKPVFSPGTALVQLSLPKRRPWPTRTSGAEY